MICSFKSLTVRFLLTVFILTFGVWFSALYIDLEPNNLLFCDFYHLHVFTWIFEHGRKSSSSLCLLIPKWNTIVWYIWVVLQRKNIWTYSRIWIDFLELSGKKTRSQYFHNSNSFSLFLIWWLWENWPSARSNRLIAFKCIPILLISIPSQYIISDYLAQTFYFE